MRLQIVSDATISPAQDAAIRAGLCVCFPPDREVFSRTRAWHGSCPAWSVLVTCEDSLVAHAGIVERQILVGQERVWIAGVQNVFVLPEHRGLGLFRQVMSAALEEARQRGLDFSLLFCAPDIGRKYARQGWHLLDRSYPPCLLRLCILCIEACRRRLIHASDTDLFQRMWHKTRLGLSNGLLTG